MTPFAQTFDEAAHRFALRALEVENAKTGYEQGYIARKPPTVIQEARRLVDSWFDYRYGWPLTGRDRHTRDVFLAAVLGEIKKMRPSRIVAGVPEWTTDT